MAHDIFISYSSKDKKLASAICNAFENKKIRVWIAPRDLAPGQPYASEIVRGIEQSQIMILLFNSNSFNSYAVRKEIERAVSLGKPILPFRLENISLDKEWEFYISSSHWLDVIDDPIEEAIEKLVESANSLLNSPRNQIHVKSPKFKNRKTKWWLWGIVIVLLIVLIYVKTNSYINQNNVKESVIPNELNKKNSIEPISVDYITSGDEDSFLKKELYAKVEGQRYKVDLDKDIQCISLVKQLDFDGDGLNDALIQNITACGGNGAANSFFFVSYSGEGFFNISKEFGYSWVDPIIEKWENTWSVLVQSNNAGANNYEPIEVKERYILKDGKAFLVETMKKNGLVALKEINATEFSFEKPDEIKYLYFDLDGDGLTDKIICTFWERWGAINWSIEFSSGIKFEGGGGCKRIGVLESKTLGVHDIVCGCDYVYKWNGKKYVDVEENSN
jgi:hypothetical protein